jgi:hypothetical protein
MPHEEKMAMTTFQVECGEHKGKIEAKSPGSAWRKLTKDKTSGFAPLARFREMPLNGPSYKLRRGLWHYVTPEALDELP